MAGIKPTDVDMLSLYDAFTITPILFLEDLGFCPRAKADASFPAAQSPPAASSR